MKGINLARRPFVNRRPVARLASLLWLVGVALLLVNVRLYGGHWQGTAVNRQRLAEVNRQIEEESRKLDDVDRRLRRVNLARQNRQVAFLNRLITARTFPWSALFDDLEEVLPHDVRLQSVQPTVQLKEPPREPRRRRATAIRSRRSSAEPPPEEAETDARSAPDEEEVLGSNEVLLSLSAVAKSEDAMIELIERLYASPSFRAPFLPGEVRNLASGATSFSISVVYLTRAPALPADEPAVAEAGSPAEEGARGAAVVERSGSDTTSGGETRSASGARPRSEGDDPRAEGSMAEGTRGTPGVPAGAADRIRERLRGRLTPAEGPAAAEEPSAAADPRAAAGTAGGRPAAAAPRPVTTLAAPAGSPASAGAGPPGAGLPGAASAPGAATPGTAAPGTAAPGAARPGTERPGTTVPATDPPRRPGRPVVEPEEPEPVFPEPPASATPRLRRAPMTATEPSGSEPPRRPLRTAREGDPA